MSWHEFVRIGGSTFSVIVCSYFFLANGAYTVLMVLSLRRVWVHVRRIVYQDLAEIRASAVTPPVTIIMPAWDEQDVVVKAVRSALKTDYPGLEVFVVDDGSTDQTLSRLVKAFGLLPVNLICRARLATSAVRGFHMNPEIPNLLVIGKDRGGKSDALNAGISMCRTPYFCTLDTDCLLERDALLRLMRPIINSPVNTVASGGMLRIVNGCEVKDGQIVKVSLPRKSIERFQVIEYLRSFLFSRTGWDALNGTLIVSGAFAVYHRESVVEAGGFSRDTVTEDIDLIAQHHRWAVRNKRKVRMAFTSDPVCWTECPATMANLGRQRRRWQLGLCQTLWKNSEILFNAHFGVAGMVSLPFQLYVEAVGAVVEFLGYAVIPIAFLCGMVPAPLFLLFIGVAWVYGAFLSVGAVLLEESTYRRYSSSRDLMTLLLYAVLENIGYHQVILYYRFQGVLRFLAGFRKWEKVTHGEALG
jgi:cellulose synthase/poly-beta-1,6-N-acetylglucosamine synthase-like glycosyltransferase